MLWPYYQKKIMGWTPLMGKPEIIDIIRNSKPEIEALYGVKKVGLFGSYVRDQQRKKSDIDILVSFSRDIDLFDFIDLRMEYGVIWNMGSGFQVDKLKR